MHALRHHLVPLRVRDRRRGGGRQQRQPGPEQALRSLKPKYDHAYRPAMWVNAL